MGNQKKSFFPQRKSSPNHSRHKRPAHLQTRAQETETSNLGMKQTQTGTGSPNPETKKTQRKTESQTRAFDTSYIRAMEGEGNERRFLLSFSSEEPYERFWGKEILDHSPEAVDLSRLHSTGVLLFNHNRDKVLGKILRAWVENRRGMAEVEFDSDEASEVIFQKVKSGTLKGVSIGYRIDVTEDVNPGKVSSDGRFTGPCTIAKQWTPHEISIVSVPADTTVGVGRELKTQKAAGTLSCFEAQLQINQNKG